MNEAFIKKNVKLSLELDSYLAKHPQLYDVIPNGAYLIITIQNDEAFNSSSRALLRNPKRKKIVEAQKSKTGWTLQPVQLAV